jgi:endonuclease-3
MSSPNRAALIAKAHKVLKQHYEPVKPHPDRALLQQMLFACCLENAPFETAEKVYARLEQTFFDWNEVRVSTVTELAEVMKDLPEPSAAANNLKKILQGVFESTYSFDLDQLKKQNIGQGIKRLQSLDGVSAFVLAYTVQAAMEGHSIPLDRGALDVLGILGIASAAEVQSGNVSGLERAIPKNKGVEFGSLLHRLAADYVSTPHSPNVKKIITAINPQAVIPKRAAKPLPAPAPREGKDGKQRTDGKAKPDGKPGETKPSVKGADHKPVEPAKAEAPGMKKTKPAEKLPAKVGRPELPPPKKVEKKAEARISAKKKSPTKQLSKKKPR